MTLTLTVLEIVAPVFLLAEVGFGKVLREPLVWATVLGALFLW